MLISRIRFVVLNGVERKPRERELEDLADEINKVLYDLGFRSPFGHVVKDYGKYYMRLSDIRLNKAVWGTNKSPYSSKTPFCYRTVLNYWQWGIVNTAINTVLDVFSVSANVRSLNGLFVIRERMEKMDFYDWSTREYDNIGSIFHPIIRCEAWCPRDLEKFSKAVDKAEIKLLNYVENSDLLDISEINSYITYNFKYIRQNCPFYVCSKVITDDAKN